MTRLNFANRPHATIVAILFATVIAVSPAQAGLVQVGSASGMPSIDDTIDWSALGSPLTAFTPPVAVTSTGGRSASVSGSPSITLFTGAILTGDFLPGDYAISAFDLDAGPLASGIHISLPFLVYALGTQIQVDPLGSFTGKLEAFDVNDVSLGIVSVTSTIFGNGDGSAPFLGAYSTGAAIASVTFTADQPGVAINGVDLDLNAPEPSTITLAFGALAALVLRRKRR